MFKFKAKLQDFFKEKEKNSKRFKSLLSFSEEATYEEEHKIYSEHYEMIFTVVHERFAELESTKLKTQKGKAPLKDLLNLMLLVKKIILHLGSLIKERWQLEKISAIIEKTLFRLNHQQVRSFGFELLLYFMEALQNSMEERHIHQFATAVNLDPFIQSPENKSKVILKHVPKYDVTNPANILYSSSDPPTKADGIELLNVVLLDYMTTKTQNFLFWFNLFKDKYLSVFYPKIFRELRLLDKYDETGFNDFCPPEIQQILIDRLTIWGDKPTIYSIMWDPTVNAPILLEIHRQTCFLSLQHQPTSLKAIQTFNNWLLNSQKNKIFADQLQNYWQLYIKNLALVFSIECTAAEHVDPHHALCKEALQTYNYFSQDLAQKHTKETWEVLQYTIMMTVFDLMNKTTTSLLTAQTTSNSQSTSYNPKFIIDLLNRMSPNSQRNTLETFADHLFDTLYFVWIRSQINDDSMWQDLSKKVSALVNFKANLVQWKEKVLQLTYIIRDILYARDKRKPGSSFVTPRDSVDNEAKEKDKTAEEKFTRKSTMKDLFVVQSASPVSRDPRLSGMSWTPVTIQKTWHTLLQILGNITTIIDPVSYEIAMSCVFEVVCLLTHAEDKLPLNESEPLPLMKIFLPWLIEGCVYNEKLIKGMLLAYRTLCRLFCRKHKMAYNQSQLNQLLSHFYRIIQMGLNNVKSEVIWEIIENSVNIFAYDLPGVAVLIPDFLREIEVLCGSQNTNLSAVKHNALLILNSLICYPNHFAGLDFPIVAQTKPYETKKPDTILTSEDLKDKISFIYMLVLNNLSEQPDIIVLALCGATVLLFEELHHFNIRATVVTKFVNSILEACDHSNDHVAQVAAECLTALSLMYKKFETQDKTLIVTIVTTLANKIIKGIQQPTKRETVVANLLFCMKDWLLSDSIDLFLDREIVIKVFMALEYALLGELVTDRAEKRRVENAAASQDNKDKESKDAKSDAKKQPQTMRKQTALNSSSGSFSPATPRKSPSTGNLGGQSVMEMLQTIFEELKNSPAHMSYIIREAGEITLLQLLYQYNNFPALGGPELTSGTIPDSDGSPTLYFTYNDLMIVSISQIAGSKGNGKTARINVRDSTGKYTWELSQYEDNLENVKMYLSDDADWGSRTGTMMQAVALDSVRPSVITLGSGSPSSGQLNTAQEDVVGPSTPVTTLVPYSRQKIDLPKFNDTDDQSNVDMLFECLLYLGEKHGTEVHPNPDFLTKPDFAKEQSATSYTESVLEKITLIDEYTKLEQQRIADMKTKYGLLSKDVDITKVSVPASPSNNNNSPESSEPVRKTMVINLADYSQSLANLQQPPLPNQPLEVSPTSLFYVARNFLHNLGLLNKESRRRFHILDTSTQDQSVRFHRSLKELDSISGRELFKIGLIYVASGQEQQSEILANDKGSDLYEEFVGGIGWPVDIKTHAGFIGGLDRNGNLKDMPYYATATSESIFHVVTRMPTNTADPQQIEKKKHVGNDFVHVIWSEHYRDYKPTTISSQFNDAHIVVYPMSNGLFRIQINRKAKVPFFGPLVDGMVLNKRLVCELVRQTAVNASRRTRMLSKGYQKPFPTRNAFLKELVHRHKTEKSFDQFLSQLYLNTNTTSEKKTAWIPGK